jgi:hypothetical protein
MKALTVPAALLGAFIATALVLSATNANPNPNGATYSDPSVYANPTGPYPWKGWRPLSDASPFNTPLPAGSFTNNVSPSSSTYVADLVRGGGPHPIATQAGGQGYYGPTYYGHDSDPLYTIQNSGVCSHFPTPCGVRAPDGIQTTDGSDHSMTIYWNANVYSFEGCQVSGHTISVVSGRSTCGVRYGPAGGSGVGGASNSTGFGYGLNAAGFSSAAGRVRPQEVLEGVAGAVIPHALAVSVTYDSGTSVCPADSSPDGGGGSIPEGTLFQLDPSYAASGLPPYEQAVALAAQRYGVYVSNTSGGGGFALTIEGDKTYTQFPGRAARWPIVARQQAGGASSLTLNDIPWNRLRALSPSVVPGC